MKYDKESLNRLSEWMKQKEWTKREFASRMGIHEANVNKYLNGILNLENLELSLIREGCDIAWLQTGERQDNSASEEKAMMEMLKSMGINSREQLQKLLDPEDFAKDIQQAISTLVHQRRGKR